MPLSRFIRSRFVEAKFATPKFHAVAGGSSGLTTVSFLDSATSSESATITGPATITAGDLLVLFDHGRGSLSLPSTVIPTGFTSIVNTTGGLIRSICSYKIADGSEASAALTGMDANGTDHKMLLVFRGDAAIASVTAASVVGAIGDADPTAQVVTSSGGAVPLIVFGAYGSSAAVDPRSFTPAKDAEISPVTRAYFAYKIYNSSPADVTIDMDDEGSGNSLQSFYLALD